MELRGYIVLPKIYLLTYDTWDDDIISSVNYVMISKRRPPWIRNPEFQNFSKTSENRQKLLKSTHKQVKMTASKLILIDKNMKITNLEKHSCQNVSDFGHNNLS